VPTALLTTFLSPYRVPLYERLAERHRIEVLCYGGGARYVPGWFSDLDAQLEAATFPARRLDGIREALRIGRRYDAVIAPFAGGAILPAAYAGARRYGRPFILWASVWAQPRSVAHAATLPLIRHIYRSADSVIAYGEHVRRFVARIRGRADDVFIAPQAVEPELFGRALGEDEVRAFRAEHGLPHGPLVLYVGRIVPEKGIGVLLDAWPQVGTKADEATLVEAAEATLVLIGDGSLSAQAAATPRTRLLGPLPRVALPVAYAAAEATVVPSIATPRFREPWGLVCNEAMHQGRPVVATTAVGAAAGGLVRDGETGLVVRSGDPPALARAIGRLLADADLRSRLGEAGRRAVAAYTYDAMVEAIDRALDRARRARGAP
jgi:glycosyltransferase involved in cell wall biosynthesis